MLVYRVQDKRGRGPFGPGLAVKWLEPRADHDNLTPYYIQWPEFRPTADSNHGCACINLNQLRRWFTESEYKKLQALGFKAVRMKVDEVLRQSEIQCIFRRKKALRKDVEPIVLY